MSSDTSLSRIAVRSDVDHLPRHARFMSRLCRTLLLAMTCLLAQPGAAGADLAEHFQATLDRLRFDFGFPGATAAYVLPDGSSGVAATGLADVENQTPMTVRSRMLAASIGKTFVGATMVALAQEGRLDLDAPLSRYLSARPWFTRLPNHDSITLRHLLNHSSGLADHVHAPAFAAEAARTWGDRDNPFPPEKLIGYVLDQPALFGAGQGWAYSDTGYILLGLVIEAVTSERYEAGVEARFLGPLALTLTTPADRRDLPALAAGYTHADNPFGLPPKTTTHPGLLAWHPGMEWTGGGLVSNALDLARWGAALFGERAMAEPYLYELLRAVPTGSNTPGVFYGAGVAIDRSSPHGEILGHGGWIPGYVSSLRHVAGHGVTVAFQVNTDIDMQSGDMPVVRVMEQRLLEAVLSARTPLRR